MPKLVKKVGFWRVILAYVKIMADLRRRNLDLSTAKVLVEDTREGQLEGNRLFEKWYRRGLKKIKIDCILSQPCVSY